MFINFPLTLYSIIIRPWLDRFTVTLGLAAIIVSFQGGDLSADPPRADKQETASPLIKFRTLGGTQFWSDQLVFHGWRIQRNELTRHHRLLDGKNYRHTWGTVEHCQATLEKLKQQLKLPAIQGNVVIVLHGLGRTRNSMNSMCQYLEKHGNYTVVSMSYASTRAGVQAHAQSLHHVISGLSQAKEISFVAHSLGNLVIRHYLNDTKKRLGTAPPLGSIVMLAPPNQGSSMARRFKDNKVVRTVWGVSGDEIASQWPQLSSRLAIPGCPFGIIAGKSDKPALNNPLIDGGDDLVVTVEETRLSGARDFLVAPAVHTYLMDHPEVQVATLRFLQHGYFQSEAKRKPIQPTPRENP